MKLSNAVIEFQKHVTVDWDYGLTNEDCAAGLRAIFALAGVEYNDDVEEVWKAERQELLLEYEEREQRRLAARTPEEVERDEKLAARRTALKKLDHELQLRRQNYFVRNYLTGELQPSIIEVGDEKV